ncbi:uncharacterized protein LOC133494922 [Syngnathoides biaculeatus]|uniref:uncharacterized protein LOC133494922 n=1 Tax=Syngnathoides biaculeatus TaxID=300417 RepID=UPI002ADDDA90|nr:uncharacterized protein LOC133494922 [Syngnathoides biaculeatus]
MSRFLDKMCRCHASDLLCTVGIKDGERKALRLSPEKRQRHNGRVAKMASTFNKAHLRKVTEKKQLCDGALHPSPFGILDLLNTQKCLKEFFAQRGMFGDDAASSEVNQNGTSNLKAKERDDKINHIIKSIVEKSIADIAKMRQLIALWDAEERSASHSYIDESSYGVVTQQKIKQYLRDFFSERLTSAEHPREFHDGADRGPYSSAEAAKEEEPGSSLSSPVIGKALTMISHVMQPVVDTIDSATRVTKTVVSMLGWNDRDDKEPETADRSDEGARQNWAQWTEDTGAEGPSPSSAATGRKKNRTDREHPVQSLSPSMEQSVEVGSPPCSPPANQLGSGRKDASRVPPAMFDEAVMEELCNLQFEIQLTPRLSPILEETWETNSSASSSAVLEKTCLFEAGSGSSFGVPSEANAGPIFPTNAVQGQADVFGEEEEALQKFPTGMELTPQVWPLTCQKPNAVGDSTDERMSSSEFSEEEVAKASSAVEAWSTPRLLHTFDGVSPVPSPATSSPMIEKAKNLINQVIQPVVDTIDSASKVTKTAGKSIAKKVRSMWKYRSGRKKGKRAKGRTDKKAERTGRRAIFSNEEERSEEDEEEEEEEEECNTAEVDSISQVSGALDDAELVRSSEGPAGGFLADSKAETSADILDDVAVEDFCFFEAESSSVISTPFLDPRMAASCDPTSSASASASAALENCTPDILEQTSCNSVGWSSIPGNQRRASRTDEGRASEINPLQSEDDGPEHNIYSIFENIFREEFSKKLENSLRQGLCDAVRVYVPERSSTDSFESTNISGELADNCAKLEMDTSSVGPQDSLESGSTSITSFTSYQLLEDGTSRRRLSDADLKGIPPEGCDSKRKSLWKRWRMRRARKVLPGHLEGRFTSGAADNTSSDGKAVEPAIKSILKKVTSIWK